MTGPTWRVICADVLIGLAQLPDASVQTVVTSPPYWGLRDYGTAEWDGGDPACDHIGPPMRTNNKPSDNTATFHGGTQRASEPWPNGICGKCGARRIDQQLGLEPTPEAYVERLVEVFREVRRVLRPDGTVWLNLGDSYASIGRSARKESPGVGAKQEMGRVEREVVWSPRDEGDPDAHFRWSLPGGQKPKDLVGIPWRVAFALQADGWWLRSDIIWAKPNPMPESVTDRPTKAHEYVFLFTKSARYFWDADAVRESLIRVLHGSQWKRDTLEIHSATPDGAVAGDTERLWGSEAGRNMRSVWNIATEPYPEAHFATFPKALVVPCVKAGTSEKGCCPECGAAWVRGLPSCTCERRGQSVNSATWPMPEPHDPIPCTVLDPFAGSGTVGVVALRLGRSFVGIELSPEYAEMARRRISDDAPLFNVQAEEGVA